MQARYDAILVGAGPAASAAAITLRRANLSCLILERQPFPRHRPGETLHPGMEPLFRQLGVWESVLALAPLRPSGVMVQAGEQAGRYSPYGASGAEQWRGFQLERARLDALLLRRAGELGAQVAIPCRARHILVDKGRVVGAATDQGVVRARFLIDCSGGRHWLATQLGMGIRRVSRALFARYGYLAGRSALLADTPLLRFDDRGWTWLAQVAPELVHWTRLDVLPAPAAPDSAARIAAMVARLLQGDGPAPHIDMRASRGADVSWRVVDRPAGGGYFIAGDAAAVLDPASSHGVLRAIMSGIYAASLATRGDATPRAEQASQAEYCQWIRAWFFNDVREITARYAEAFGAVATLTPAPSPPSRSGPASPPSATPPARRTPPAYG